MGFGLNFNSCDFLPYIKINGKEGRIERSTYDGSERGTEIIENFVALFDFATVQVGWMRFEGDAPDMRLVAIGDPGDDRRLRGRRRLLRGRLRCRLRLRSVRLDRRRTPVRGGRGGLRRRGLLSGHGHPDSACGPRLRSVG